MKNIKIILLLSILFVLVKSTIGQTINWENIKSEQKHILNINAGGWDYAFVFGAGYGYKLSTKLPIILNAEYSFPSGKNLIDDFKTKIGGKVRVCQIKNFQLSANMYGVFRRYENPLVRLVNFGSDVSGVAGYYRSKWFIAGEAGFDKAIVTHFKHSNVFKETIYSNVKDGWYEPATGGNFYYGLQTGFSFNQMDLTFKVGKVITQDFKTTPLIPYYAQLGINYKMNSK